MPVAKRKKRETIAMPPINALLALSIKMAASHRPNMKQKGKSVSRLSRGGAIAVVLAVLLLALALLYWMGGPRAVVAIETPIAVPEAVKE